MAAPLLADPTGPMPPKRVEVLGDFFQPAVAKNPDGEVLRASAKRSSEIGGGIAERCMQ